MNKYKIFLVTLISIFLSSCSQRDENTWKVATSADNPPYEYMKNGEVIGFDIDLMEEIGKKLNKKIEFENLEFHGLLASLSSRTVDMVIAGMSITKEREAQVSFSIPYTSGKISVLYRKADGFSSPENLRNKEVGAQLGTIWTLIAHNLSTTHDFTIKSLSSNLMLIEELKNKQIDAVVLEAFQANKFIDKYPEFDSFLMEEYSSSFAIALPKNSPLKKDIDDAIRSLQEDKVIDGLARKWGLLGA